MTEHSPPARLTTEALLAGLAAHAVSLDESARQLRESYRFSRWLKVTIAIGVVMTVLNSVTLVVLLHLATSNHQNGEAIRSCTTPTGRCYQRGQRTTGQAVAQIVAQVNAHTDLVLVSALQCWRHPVGGSRFTVCLARRGVALH